MKIKKIINNIEGYLSMWILIIMLVVLLVQVVSRWLGVSNQWSEELARYMFVWMIYLGGSTAVQTNSHVKIDTLMLIWPKKIRPYIALIGYFMWIILGVFITYYAAIFTYNIYMAKTVAVALKISMAFAYASVPVGYGFMVIRIVQCLIIPQIKALFWKKTADEEIDLIEGGGK